MLSYEYIKNRYSENLKKRVLSEELHHGNYNIIKDYILSGGSFWNVESFSGLLDGQTILQTKGYDRDKVKESIFTKVLSEEQLSEVKEFVFKKENIPFLFQTNDNAIIKNIFSYVFKALVEYESKDNIEDILNYVFTLSVFKYKDGNDISGEGLYSHSLNDKYDSKKVFLISYLYEKNLKNILHGLYKKNVLPLLDKKLIDVYDEDCAFSSVVNILIKLGDMKELKFFLSHYEPLLVKNFLDVKFNSYYRLKQLLPQDVDVYFELKEMNVINLSNQKGFKDIGGLISFFIDNKKNIVLTDILVSGFEYIKNSSYKEKKEFLDDVFSKDRLGDNYFDAIVFLKDINVFKVLLDLNDEVGYGHNLLDLKYWTEIGGSRRKVTLAEYLVLNDAYELFYVLNEHMPVDIKRLKKTMENNDISEKTFTAFENIMLKLDSNKIIKNEGKIKRRL